jgi:hypothetical protein
VAQKEDEEAEAKEEKAQSQIQVSGRPLGLVWYGAPADVVQVNDSPSLPKLRFIFGRTGTQLSLRLQTNQRLLSGTLRGG